MGNEDSKPEGEEGAAEGETPAPRSDEGLLQVPPPRLHYPHPFRTVGPRPTAYRAVHVCSNSRASRTR